MLDVDNLGNGQNMTDGVYFIGIDVGTGSARAGVFDEKGTCLATGKQDIRLYREAHQMVEQSSTDIWQAVCASVRGAMHACAIAPEQVAGIGFDATCSLVVLGDGGASLAVGPSEDNLRDVIVWMDHRAVDEAERINTLGHSVLHYVGGRISPEMQTPKLLWLKENRPATFASAWQFFDLADFLTWRATGDLARSTCTVTCKWTYLAHEQRWDPSYFQEIGLGELTQENFSRIGQTIVEPGTPVGDGLTPAAALELGLVPGTPVSAGMIDAHAGGIGTVGIGGQPERNLGYVFGTSSCTLTSTRDPVFVPGVWGPYYSAMVPGMWLNEGGQSAAGAAIDHLLAFHPSYPEALELARAKGESLPLFLSKCAEERLRTASDAVTLAAGLHVVPEFLGNRAPFADPHARAVVAGLGMERDLDHLLALYVAGLCGIGYGLRQILEAQSQAGADVEQIVISGGAGQSLFVRQILADASGKTIIAPLTAEPVLLGGAMLGATASRSFDTLNDAMRAMSQAGAAYEACTGALRTVHDRRYEAFKALQGALRAARDC